MLAYELVKENSETNQEPGRGIPIKKIFIENNRITIDDKNIDEYGYYDTPNMIIQSLQKNLDMPLDTNSNLNLPNKRVASNSPKPYVIIPGYYKAYFKKDQLIGELTLGDSKKGYFAKLNLSDLEDEITSADVLLKIDTKNYVQKDQTLYEAYCKNNIIQNKKLSAQLFEKITKKFFEYVKSKDIAFTKGNTAFLLYILPNDKKITYVDVDNDDSENTINELDSFGNKIIAYPKSPTTGVFFMSYDDKAFTINCTEKEKFYKDLGIGKESYEKILLPNNKMINISGFNWYFLDLGKPDKIFSKTNEGIYRQLHSNYKDMTSELITKNSVQLHVICIKKTKSKLEVMINENLSMPKLHELFANVDDNIPRHALELLIIRKGQSTIFRYYMMAIKSLLNKTPFDSDLLIKIFTDKIRNEYRDWLTKKNSNDAKDFFNRSEFCCKTLNSTNKSNKLMKEAEFAKSVGQMAREYVNFRKETNNDNNSLRDILSKQKYDIETLKFVIKTVGRGIHLLNINPEQYDVILSKISSVAPSADIDDSNRKDFAYYFYMGYFGDNKN